MDAQVEDRSPQEVRLRIRSGDWTGPTVGLAPGYVQANLVILPEEHAPDFERFCRANPQALPLLDVTTPGSAIPLRAAPEADLRLDLPRYRVYRDGRLEEEPSDIVTLWRSDFVAFLLGCSFTFDALLAANAIRVRHVEMGRNVPMFVTNRATIRAGRFFGPLVVSMRPIRRGAVRRAVELTRSVPLYHGEPIHIGSPAELGIHDLESPQYGDPVPVLDGEVPVFWACGVTALAAAEYARIPRMITHAPGHMFITDLRIEPPTAAD